MVDCTNETVTDGRRIWGGLAILAVLAGWLLFTNLSHPLLEPDEGRHAEVGREMLGNGDWLVPHLNGRPYLNKPPLFYWLVATSLHLFGPHEFAARLVPATAALATVLITFLLGRRVLGTRAAFLAAVALAFSAGFLHCGRFVVLDGVLNLFLTAALLSAFLAMQGDRPHWGWWLTAAGCCALGVLTKGPVALILVAAPVLLHAWLGRPPGRPRWTHWAVFLAVTAAVAGPWYLTVVVRQPEFARQFFLDQNLQRFVGNQHHSQPFWYYLPVVVVGCLPWTLLAPHVIRFLWSRAEPSGPRRQAYVYFLFWFGWCVLFFSLSRGKLPTYLLPAAPAAALLVGGYLDRLLDAAVTPPLVVRARQRLPRVVAPLLGLVWLGFLVVRGRIGVSAADGWLDRCWEVGLCAASVAALLTVIRGLPAIAGWTLTAVLAAGIIVETTHDLVPAWATRQTILPQGGPARALLDDPANAVACYGQQWGSVAFALGRDNVRTFEYDEIRAVKQFLREHPRTVVILPPGVSVETVYRWLPRTRRVCDLVETRKAHFVLVGEREEATSIK